MTDSEIISQINDFHFRQRALEKLLGVTFDDKTTSYIPFDWSSAKGREISDKVTRNKSYKYEFRCTNCGEKTTKEIPCGEKVESHKGFTCRNCGIVNK